MTVEPPYNMKRNLLVMVIVRREGRMMRMNLLMVMVVRMMMELVRMMKRRIGEENVDQTETKLLLVKKILLQLGFLPPTAAGR